MYLSLTDLFVDMPQPIEIQIVGNISSSDSEDSVIGRPGNRVTNEQDAARRAAERRLLRDNNPLANLGIFSQQLGREATERLRSVIEERKNQNIAMVTNRINLNWLRNHLSTKELESIEDKQYTYLRTIVDWYGSLGGSLLIKLKNMKIDPIEADYK